MPADHFPSDPSRRGQDPDRTLLAPTRPGDRGTGGDRTLANPPSSAASAAAATTAANATLSSNALPVGARLGEFEILGVIGEGGFGIVYRALDRSLGRTIALKEYMPTALTARTQDLTVALKSEKDRETFEIGLRSFINEARLLAQFDHPALVKVFRFWEANQTAYMVMPLYAGGNLKQALKALDAPPDEAWLRSLLGPLLDAIALLHENDCLHRDISPDNILLIGPTPREPEPLLLDLGAARRVIGDRTQALTVMLRPGFAPVEQYDEIPGMKQGPWTDIYALGAVLHFAITGRPPPASVGRMVNDTLVPLAAAARGRYSAGFLGLIDQMLAPLPADRPQQIGAIRAALSEAAAPAAGSQARADDELAVSWDLTPPAPAPATIGVPMRSEPVRPASIPPAPPARRRRATFVIVSLLMIAGAAALALLRPQLDALVDDRWNASPPPAAAPPPVTAAPIDAGAAVPASVPSASTPGDAPSAPAADASTTRPASAVVEPSAAPVAGETPTHAVDANAAPTVRPNPRPPLPRASAQAPSPPRATADATIAASPAAPSVPSSTTPSTPAPSVDAAAPPAWIGNALREGRECLDARRYDCALARASEILKSEPANESAQRLAKLARIGQEEALSSDWKMR